MAQTDGPIQLSWPPPLLDPKVGWEPPDLLGCMVGVGIPGELYP